MEGGSGQAPRPSAAIDKSRVLDVKPLRCLVPNFPSPPQGPPFVCAPPFGPYSPGFSPFYPFNTPQPSQNQPEQSQQTNTPRPSQNQPEQSQQTNTTRGGINQDGGFSFSQPTQTPSGPTPIRSFRASPVGVPSHFSGASNGDVEASFSTPGEDGVVDGQKRSASRKSGTSGSRKKSKAAGSGEEFLSISQTNDGDKKTVDLVLLMFDAIRRKLSQLEEAKESTPGAIKRPDLKAGSIVMNKMIRTNTRKRIGFVPGVEIGDVFFFRMEMCLVGLHAQSMAGIDAMHIKMGLEEESIAISIVSSGGYGDEAEDPDVLIYSGQGGNMNKNDKLVQVADQKLERGNLALDKSSQRANEIRVIRGVKDPINPLSKVYVYDGLYTIQQSWVEKGKSDCNVFKYKLVRLPGQPFAYAIWKSIQKWKEGFATRAGLILPDLSSGAERIPVSLVNDVDAEKGPAYFTYFPSLKNAKSFSLRQPSFGCNCVKACRPGDLNCSCTRKNGGSFPYTANGVLVSRKSFINECGPTCPCSSTCKNRVSQSGVKVRLEVFKTKDKGWGLRSWDPIRAGSFICEYAGELVEKQQDGIEGDYDEYMFDTTRIYDESLKWNYEPSLLDEEGIVDTNEDFTIAAPLCISSKNIGNVSRFMNHSCYPNALWQPIVQELDNEAYLHIAFFAIKHIPPMVELTYDYGVSQSGYGKKKCFCRSPKCRGYFG